MVVRSLLTVLGFKSDERQLKSYGDALKKVIGFVKVAAVATVAMGTAVLKLAGDMEQTEIAFETMLKSADKANDLIQEITEFAARTPFQLTGLIQSSKQLLAFGFQSEEIIKTMTNLGNIAAGVGRDKLPTLVDALGKIRTKGRASMRELNMMLQAGVPILDQLAKNYGKTTSEVIKMVSRGEVGFKDVNKALEDMSTGTGLFANLMEKQSKSFLGIVSNIGDVLTNLGVAIGKDLLPWAKELAKAFLDWLKANKEIIKGGIVAFFKAIFRAIAFVVIFIRELIERMGGLQSIGSSLGGVFKFIGDVFMFFVRGIIFILKLLWPLRKIILLIVVAVKAWTIIQAIINFLLTLNPIGIIIVAIGVLIGLIVLLIANWEHVKKVFIAGWQKIGDFLKGIWDGIIKGLTAAWNGVANFFKGLWEGIVNGFLMAWEAITYIMKLPGKIVEWLKGIWEKVGTFFSDLWEGIVKNIKSAWENIIGGLKKIWDDFMKFIQPVIDAITEVFGFFGGSPEVAMAGAGATTGGRSTTTTIDTTVNLTVPPGTPEEQAAYIREQNRRAVEEVWKGMLKEGIVNNPGG